MENKAIVVFGPTASGKTAYSIKLAQTLDGEVINADSQQVYRQIPILSAAPSESERLGIVHHLFCHIDLWQHYNAATWAKQARQAIAQVKAAGKIPILVGGTGLYLRSLMQGIAAIPEIDRELHDRVINMSALEVNHQLAALDPSANQRLNTHDIHRRRRALEVIIMTGKSIYEWQLEQMNDDQSSQYHCILLMPQRQQLYDKINQRVISQFLSGAIEEVASIIAQHNYQNLPKAHGLPEIAQFLQGDITYQEALARTQQHVRNYAKRQLTWARHQFQFNEIIEV